MSSEGKASATKETNNGKNQKIISQPTSWLGVSGDPACRAGRAGRADLVKIKNISGLKKTPMNSNLSCCHDEKGAA